MFEMMYEANFTYDSSMPVYENKPPAFPYTMDYKMPHDCMIPPCPEKAYPGKGSILCFMLLSLFTYIVSCFADSYALQDIFVENSVNHIVKFHPYSPII